MILTSSTLPFNTTMKALLPLHQPPQHIVSAMTSPATPTTKTATATNSTLIIGMASPGTTQDPIASHVVEIWPIMEWTA